MFKKLLDWAQYTKDQYKYVDDDVYAIRTQVGVMIVKSEDPQHALDIVGSGGWNLDIIERHGVWEEEINDEGEREGWHCSNCYDETGFHTYQTTDYCPRCGARMAWEEE